MARTPRAAVGPVQATQAWQAFIAGIVLGFEAGTCPGVPRQPDRHGRRWRCCAVLTAGAAAGSLFFSLVEFVAAARRHNTSHRLSIRPHHATSRLLFQAASAHAAWPGLNVCTTGHKRPSVQVRHIKEAAPSQHSVLPASLRCTALHCAGPGNSSPPCLLFTAHRQPLTEAHPSPFTHSPPPGTSLPTIHIAS